MACSACPAFVPRRRAGPRRIVTTAQSDAQAPVTGSASDYDPIILHLDKASNQTLSSPFKQYIERYHYLAYRIPFGALSGYSAGRVAQGSHRFKPQFC